jgi:hypothetical protein
MLIRRLVVVCALFVALAVSGCCQHRCMRRAARNACCPSACEIER